MNPNFHKTIGYLRVSTVDQDIEKNKVDILKLGNSKDLGKIHFVEERVSGKVSWRNRKIADVMEELQAGDNLVVSELSRLGRSMLECMEILSIASQKGINIYAVKGAGNSATAFKARSSPWPFPWRQRLKETSFLNEQKKRCESKKPQE